MSKEKISRAERKRMKFFAEQNSQAEDIIELISSEGDKLIIPQDDFLTAELKLIRLNNKHSEKEKKRLETLAIEREKKKKEITTQLSKNPIVQYACDRTGTGRSTYYKWRADDLIFARIADRAIQAGCFFINDLAESKLVGLIQNSNPTAIIFWLKHNHPKYAAVNRIIHEYEVLTTNKPSVEEESVADQEIAKMITDKMIPTEMTREEAHIGGLRLKHEEEEAERNIKHEERMKSFEDDEENK